MFDFHERIRDSDMDAVKEQSQHSCHDGKIASSKNLWSEDDNSMYHLAWSSGDHVFSTKQHVIGRRVRTRRGKVFWQDDTQRRKTSIVVERFRRRDVG